MADDNGKKDEVREVVNLTASTISNSMGNLAFVFVLVLIFKWIGSPIIDYVYGAENRPEWISGVALAFLTGSIVADPYQAWKEKKVNYRFFAKFGFGFLIGYLLLAYGLDRGSENVDIVAEKDSKADISWLPWLAIALPLLMMPVLFGKHALDRFEQNREAQMKNRLADAALEYVNTSGPVIMLAVMGMCALFFWIVELPLGMLIAFLTTLLVGIIAYCTFFYDGSEEPVTDEDYAAPRSRTFGDALSRALDVSIQMLPGVVFMTGLIWVAMAFWDISAIDPGKGEDFNPVVIIWPVIKASLIAIVVVPGGMIIANILGAISITSWAQFKGMGFTEAKLRSDKFNEMLYGGAMGKLFHGNLKKRNDQADS
jgi:hypothetical protein